MDFGDDLGLARSAKARETRRGGMAKGGGNDLIASALHRVAWKFK